MAHGRPFVQDVTVRATPAIAAFLAALCVACTSSAGTPDRTMTAPHTTVAPQSTPPTSPPTTKPTSTHPPDRPTVPADVPRTGPNTRKGEKPPVMPVAATKHTAAGAKAFAEFFIKTIDWGYATVNGNYVRDNSAPDCTGCVSFAEGFDKARNAGHHYVGGRISITSVVPRNQHGSFDVNFSITAFAELTRTDHVVQADQAHAHERFLLVVAWHGAAWRASRLAIET